MMVEHPNLSQPNLTTRVTLYTKDLICVIVKVKALSLKVPKDFWELLANLSFGNGCKTLTIGTEVAEGLVSDDSSQLMGNKLTSSSERHICHRANSRAAAAAAAAIEFAQASGS